MGTISSQFIVTALADGTTIHGSLSSDKTLTQIVGSTVSPNWETDASSRPTITLRVMAGNALLSARNYTWSINGQAIEFGNQSQPNINTAPSWCAGTFQKGESTIGAATCPTLKIIKNLGGSGNVDLDVISITGQIESNGTLVDFSAGIEVKISRATGSGYIPSLAFVNGKSWIDTKNEFLRIYALLATDKGAVSGYTCRWYRNYSTEVTASSPSSNQSYKGTYNSYPCLNLYEGDVEDYTVIRCEFWKDGVLVATETVNIDDEQDPDQLYITYGAANVSYNGTPASLKAGGEVTFSIWVGRQDDPNHAETMDKYKTYKALLLNSEGSVISGTVANFAAADANGWRALTRNSSTKIASAKVTYNVVVANGGKLTGVVQAST